MHNKLFAAAALILLALSLTGCSAQTQTQTENTSVLATKNLPPLEATAPSYEKLGKLSMNEVKAEIDSKQVEDFVESDEATLFVALTVKDFGKIVVRLRPEAAPLTVANFQALVARGYYNGTTFHRVYPGFMIQGGAGTERLFPIQGEFAVNGVKNPLLHIRGVLSMARTKDYNSATSQFFLMHADSDYLDGSYAAFGYVVAGLDTVDLICKIDRKVDPSSGERTLPLEDVVIESAVFVRPL